jgi:hypothetical protein
MALGPVHGDRAVPAAGVSAIPTLWPDRTRPDWAGTPKWATMG